MLLNRSNVAGLAALGTIVETVDAKADPIVRLAEAAIFVALAQWLGLIALRTEGRHRLLPFPPCVRLPATPILGHARPPSKQAEIEAWVLVFPAAVRPDDRVCRVGKYGKSEYEASKPA
jgi:hypothetical protein